MKRRTPQSPRGFTIVELMIAVAIIALVVAVALPNYIRARKRAQSTRMVDDLRLIDNALDLYATENTKAAGAPAGWADLQPYLKRNIVLYNSGGIDLLGNMINDNLTFSVDSVPRVNSTSFAALSDVAPAEFWSPYAP